MCGERVLALGFPDLDVEEGSEERPISQYLYGSFGEITDVKPADGARGRPWPMIRVADEWPGGMRGGPVFNEIGRGKGRSCPILARRFPTARLPF